MRNIIHFKDSDVGKQVKFSPHEDSVIYELALVGKTGVITEVKNRLFDQLITVDFNYIHRFAHNDILKKQVLSGYVAVRAGYERKWKKGCAPKYPLVLDLGHVLTDEEKQIYNKHFHRFEQLLPNVVYTVVENESGKCLSVTESVTVSFEDPASFIGPIWKVSGNNLIFN